MSISEYTRKRKRKYRSKGKRIGIKEKVHGRKKATNSKALNKRDENIRTEITKAESPGADEEDHQKKRKTKSAADHNAMRQNREATLKKAHAPHRVYTMRKYRSEY